MSLLVKGVTSFLALTDTPASYAGETTKVAAVNAGEDGLEFTDPPVGIVGTFNSIEPELYAIAAADTWETHSLANSVPEGATGAIFHIRNRHTSDECYIGARMTGSSLAYNAGLDSKTQSWIIVGLNENRQCDLFAHLPAYNDFWLMGYTGPNVHFFTTPIDCHATVDDTWQDKSISAQAPDALVAILQFGQATLTAHTIAVRKKGSTDDYYYIIQHTGAIIGLDENQTFQVKQYEKETTYAQCWCTGYIDSLIEHETNFRAIADPTVDTWTSRDIASLTANPKWVVVFEDTDWLRSLTGVKKANSYRSIIDEVVTQYYAFIHCDFGHDIDIYRQHTNDHFYVVAEIP